MDAHKMIWLAADYHFAGTYSCRVPMSSMYSALAMPAPGPATVRLALIRTGIELFGLDYTRDQLFPMIRMAQIRVRPPEKIAFSTQLIRGYKAGGNGLQDSEQMKEAPLYREHAHAAGPATVYIRVPAMQEDIFCEALAAIGYWGQADSLAYCVGVHKAEPKPGGFAIPLKDMNPRQPVRDFFSCFVSEFRDMRVGWEEVVPALLLDKPDVIVVDVYVWPLLVVERHRGRILLLHRSLT